MRRDIPERERKINLSEKTDNLIRIYNETATEGYIDKQE